MCRNIHGCRKLQWIDINQAEESGNEMNWDQQPHANNHNWWIGVVANTLLVASQRVHARVGSCLLLFVVGCLWFE